MQSYDYVFENTPGKYFIKGNLFQFTILLGPGQYDKSNKEYCNSNLNK